MDLVTEKLLTPPAKTRLWVSKRAQKGLDKEAPTTFHFQLERWMTNGLANYLGVALRLEPHGVYRLGPDNSKFRLIGFFEHDNLERDDFIVILGGLKPGKRQYQEWFKEVARVRDQGDWRRNVP